MKPREEQPVGQVPQLTVPPQPSLMVPLVWPAGTVTLGGQVFTAVLLQLGVTKAQPLSAGELSVTVAIVLLPPTTGVGLNVRLVGKGGGVPHTVRSAAVTTRSTLALNTDY